MTNRYRLAVTDFCSFWLSSFVIKTRSLSSRIFIRLRVENGFLCSKFMFKIKSPNVQDKNFDVQNKNFQSMSKIKTSKHLTKYFIYARILKLN